MLLEDFIIVIFRIIDEEMKTIEEKTPIRKRGPKPTLSDSEVLMMEVVGEFLGFSQNKAIFSYFRTHFVPFSLTSSRSTEPYSQDKQLTSGHTSGSYGGKCLKRFKLIG